MKSEKPSFTDLSITSVKYEGTGSNQFPTEPLRSLVESPWP